MEELELMVAADRRRKTQPDKEQAKLEAKLSQLFADLDVENLTNWPIAGQASKSFFRHFWSGDLKNDRQNSNRRRPFPKPQICF